MPAWSVSLFGNCSTCSGRVPRPRPAAAVTRRVAVELGVEQGWRSTSDRPARSSAARLRGLRAAGRAAEAFWFSVENVVAQARLRSLGDAMLATVSWDTITGGIREEETWFKSLLTISSKGYRRGNRRRGSPGPRRKGPWIRDPRILGREIALPMSGANPGSPAYYPGGLHRLEAEER